MSEKSFLRRFLLRAQLFCIKNFCNLPLKIFKRVFYVCLLPAYNHHWSPQRQQMLLRLFFGGMRPQYSISEHRWRARLLTGYCLFLKSAKILAEIKSTSIVVMRTIGQCQIPDTLPLFWQHNLSTLRIVLISLGIFVVTCFQRRRAEFHPVP